LLNWMSPKIHHLKQGILTMGAKNTSEVPLKGLNGKQFFTIVQHGFKLHGDQEVHHPWCMSRDTLIGRVRDGNPLISWLRY